MASVDVDELLEASLKRHVSKDDLGEGDGREMHLGNGKRDEREERRADEVHRRRRYRSPSFSPPPSARRSRNRSRSRSRSHELSKRDYRYEARPSEADSEYDTLERDRERDRDRDRDHRRGSSRRSDDREERTFQEARRSYDRSYDYDHEPRSRRREPVYRDDIRQEHYPRNHDSAPDRQSRARGLIEREIARAKALAERTRAQSPPIPDEEREKRTVFCSQLAARLRSRELGEFFETNVGRVREARIVTDKNSKRSKGIGYVEFVDIESVPKAIGSSGTRLMGIPILVVQTESEKNHLAASGRGMYSRLHVGNLQFTITEDDLRQMFQPFGALDHINLQVDSESGRSRGFAYIQFKKNEDAKLALDTLNNFEMAGRALRIMYATEKQGSGAAPPSKQSTLDNEELGGNLNHISRVDLMRRLARETGNDLPAKPTMRVNVPVLSISRCVLLRDMFVAAEEAINGPSWDKELSRDVQEECEAKYGPVIFIVVDRDSVPGEIHVKFDTTATAEKAVTGLNGRYFGGRSITATYEPEGAVDARYPDAARARD